MNHGFSRSWKVKIRQEISLFGLMVVLLVAPLPAAQWDRGEAEKALEQARVLHERINSVQPLNRGEYLSCIKLYRRVWLADPHFGGCDDAIYEAAVLYQEMSEKFGAPEDSAEAARLFRFLVADYPGSPMCQDARERLAVMDSQDSEPARASQTRARLKQPAPEVARVSGPGVSSPTPATPTGTALVRSIRHWSMSDRTRVMIDLDGPVKYESVQLANPDRIFFDLSETKLSAGLSGKTIAVGDSLLRQIRLGQNRRDVARIVLDFDRMPQVSVSELADPSRIVIDIRKSGAPESLASLRAAEGAPARGQPDSRPAAAGKAEPPAPSPLPAPSQRVEARVPAVSRSEPPAAERTQPQGPAGPKPGEKAVIEPPPALPPTTRPAETAVQQKASPLPSVQIALQEPRAASKETGASRTDSVPAEKAQPASPVTNGSLATVNATPPAEPGAKSLPPGEMPGGALTRAAIELNNIRPEVPVEALIKTGTAEKLPTSNAPAGSAPSRDIPPARSASPTSKGDMTMTRVLGLKVGRIVIDPGHGGHDTGTVGRNGLMEKDLVLDVAITLKRSLEQRLGAQVLMTRSDDRFISLEERTAIANRHRADLFISIHANSSTSRSTSGVETYYLNFARTSADREIAARENATTLLNVGELQDLVRKIAMADKSTESRELAAVLQRSLFNGSRGIFPKSRNRGVRTAPFIVLIGAEMPAVLVEVAFISNPRDEKLLKKENSQQALAKALLTGIEGYLKSLAYMANNQPGAN